MRFKLDENVGRSVIAAFEAEGHDTSSVHRQRLDGAPDDQLFLVCRSEGRVLVTLDLDFASPQRFDPRPTAGVAVLRLSRNPAPSELMGSVSVLLAALHIHSISGSLWIVRSNRIRVWSPPGEPSELD